MRLYEEFGLLVSDDTVYWALKELGFSHVFCVERDDQSVIAGLMR
jgi:hypothetical protein